MKKHDINHPLWDVMNNLYIIQHYLKNDELLNELIVKAFFELLDETVEKVESLYKKDME